VHASGSLYALSSEVVEAVATAKSERFVSNFVGLSFQPNHGKSLSTYCVHPRNSRQ
jgi:hypothetical protein